MKRTQHRHLIGASCLKRNEYVPNDPLGVLYLKISQQK